MIINYFKTYNQSSLLFKNTIVIDQIKINKLRPIEDMFFYRRKFLNMNTKNSRMIQYWRVLLKHRDINKYVNIKKTIINNFYF